MLPRSTRSMAVNASVTSHGPPPGSAVSSTAADRSALAPLATSRSPAVRRLPNTALLLRLSTGGHARRSPGGVPAGRAESALAPDRTGQDVNFAERHVLHPLYHELGDPIPAPEGNRARGVRVQQDHFYLATVSRVDSPRRVDQGDAVFRGQP